MIVEFRKPVAFVDVSSQEFQELLELLEQRFPDDEFVKTLAFENSLDAPTRETRNVDEQLVDAVKACQAKKLERWAKEDGGVSLDLSDD